MVFDVVGAGVEGRFVNVGADVVGLVVNVGAAVGVDVVGAAVGVDVGVNEYEMIAKPSPATG